MQRIQLGESYLALITEDDNETEIIEIDIRCLQRQLTKLLRIHRYHP